MKIADHLLRARRIEKTMNGKLDPNRDYELFVEACALAGTHLLNVILHKSFVTKEAAEDLLHSYRPPLKTPVPVELQPLFSALRFIEDLRPGYLRTAETWRPDDGNRCLENYRMIKNFAERLLER